MLHKIGTELATTHHGMFNAGKLPKGKKEAMTMRRMACFYTIVVGEFYRQEYSQPLLKCVDGKCAQTVIEEMHEGICENYAGNRALTTKILQAKHFWPTMKQDYLKFIRKCNKC